MMSLERLRFRDLAALLLLAPMAGLSWAAPVPTSGELPVNSTTAMDQDTATVVVRDNGSFVVTWESYGQDGSYNGVFVQSFDSSGNPVGDEHMANTFTTSWQEDPDIALLSDGSFVVVWDSDGQDGSLRGIFGRRFDSAGLPDGDEFPVNDTAAGDQNDAVVAASADGGFLVAWETHPVGMPFEDLVARRFDGSGSPLGDEMPLNTFTLNDQEDVDLASDAAGNFVVTWESGGQDGSYESIVAVRLDSTGQPVGDEFVVNSYVTGDQTDPDLAVHPDGRFAIVWEDDTQDAGVPAVFARYYAADGTPHGDPFQVDADPGPQGDPRIALDADGQAVGIWSSFLQDGDGDGIFTSRFDTAGARLGGEQPTNTTTDGHQSRSHVAVGPGGHVVAVWESRNGQDGDGAGVYARLFALPLFTDGFESGDTSAWTSVSP